MALHELDGKCPKNPNGEHYTVLKERSLSFGRKRRFLVCVRCNQEKEV